MKSGFSLLELLLVLLCIVILLFVAIPSYQHLVARNKTTTVVNGLVSRIAALRAQAMAQNQVMTLCGSEDQQHCDGHWAQGQLIQSDSSGQIWRVYPGLPNGDRLWWQSNLGSNDTLKMASNGLTAGQWGSFYYCPQYKPTRYGAIVIVSNTGRVRIDSNPEKKLSEHC